LASTEHSRHTHALVGAGLLAMASMKSPSPASRAPTGLASTEHSRHPHALVGAGLPAMASLKSPSPVSRAPTDQPTRSARKSSRPSFSGGHQ
jgi:hypothetical protein